MEKISTTGDMQTLSSCMSRLIKEGYTDNLKVTTKGLLSEDKKKYYQPSEVQIVNFFRFEGASDPGDNAVLYAIETNDGVKGSLTDAYGPYADAQTGKFIKEVEDIQKKPKEV